MRYIPCVVVVMLFVCPLAAQAGGIPGLNDYTISTLGSGAPPVSSLALVPGLHTFDVSTMFPATAYIYVSPFPCTPMPFIGCQGTQLHLQVPPLPFLVDWGAVSAAGTYTFGPIPVPPGLVFSTQVVIFAPWCPPVFSQAYNITT